MGKAAVIDMTGRTVEPRKREPGASQQLMSLEEGPRPEWFVKIKSPNGRMYWFVRFSVTGRRTRRYGPFPNKQRCLRFLNDALANMVNMDGLTEGLDRAQEEHGIRRRAFEAFEWSYPIIEDTLALHAQSVLSTKGR
jgi:hypothetical protein